ncbi:GGDEF domain-containing protein [Bradyrhizobium ganzhouense]|uniref:GGDEF domain-containing protein n=1 Tax=Bradyrhizobium ganzhouense TaxID=1179767 RepID=UPI003CF790FD
MSDTSSDEIDLEYSCAIANRAMRFMAQQDVPPIPENFIVWYTYSAGASAELKRTIDVLLTNKRKFDSETSHELNALVTGTSSARVDQRLSERISGVINTVQRLLVEAAEGNHQQISSIKGVVENVGAVDSRVLLRTLVSELSAAASRATSLEKELAERSSELKAIRTSFEVAEKRSKTDSVTGLPNRRGLDEFLRSKQIVAMERGEPLSILMMDIDHFKRFNDEFGHSVGDQVLRLIATTTSKVIGPEGMAARFGGEEIVVVLPCTELTAAAVVAERTRRSISECRITRRSTGEFLSAVTVSIGVAQFRLGESMAELIDRCDQALYQAKRSGRNRIEMESN